MACQATRTVASEDSEPALPAIKRLSAQHDKTKTPQEQDARSESSSQHDHLGARRGVKRKQQSTGGYTEEDNSSSDSGLQESSRDNSQESSAGSEDIGLSNNREARSEDSRPAGSLDNFIDPANSPLEGPFFHAAVDNKERAARAAEQVKKPSSSGERRRDEGVFDEEIAEPDAEWSGDDLDLGQDCLIEDLAQEMVRTSVRDPEPGPTTTIVEEWRRLVKGGYAVASGLLTTIMKDETKNPQPGRWRHLTRKEASFCAPEDNMLYMTTGKANDVIVLDVALHCPAGCQKAHYDLPGARKIRGCSSSGATSNVRN
ncbi:hypothetical protein KFL_009470060, partial [Klebsormidium nitens]